MRGSPVIRAVGFFAPQPQGPIFVPKSSRNFLIHSGWAGQAGAGTRFPSTHRPPMLPKGTGSARPEGRHHANPHIAPVLATALSKKHRWQRNVLPFVGPHHADARSASLRENRLSRRLRAFLRRAIRGGLAPPVEGRAPHAPKEGITLTPTLPPFWPPPYRKSTGGNATSCRSWGRTTRTRRARPSGKTSLASRAFAR